MKTASLIFALLLVSACSRDAASGSTTKRMAGISAGLPRSEVLAALGRPAVVDRDLYRWEVRGDSGAYASIAVRFGADNRVEGIVRKSEVASPTKF